MKELILPAIVVAAIFLGFIVYAVDNGNKAQAACQAKGGGLVKGFNGYACVAVIK